MTAFIHTNKNAHQTWLADFLSSNITISGRRRPVTACSHYQPEIRMHGVGTSIESVSGATMSRRSETGRRV
jgi:hypothetical protein